MFQITLKMRGRVNRASLSQKTWMDHKRVFDRVEPISAQAYLLIALADKDADNRINATSSCLNLNCADRILVMGTECRFKEIIMSNFLIDY